MADALETIKAREPGNAIYLALLKDLKGIGHFEVEIKKTSLHVTNGRAFLGIHPRKNGLLINIVTQEPLKSSRVRKLEQVSKNRYHNEVLIMDVAQIDSEIHDWIREAYGLTK